MAPPTDIRAARVALARSFVAGGDRSQAVEHFRAALGESGEDPPDWEIRFELGELLRDRPQAALSEFIIAVAGAPAGSIAQTAHAALEILEDERVGITALPVSSAALGRLVERLDDTAPTELVQLITHLAYLKGDAGTVERALRIVSDDTMQATPLLASADALRRAYDLLDDDDPEGALRALQGVTGDDDLGVAAARALAHYALGQNEEALVGLDRELEDSYEGAIVRTLVWLQWRSEHRPGAEEQAADAAVDVARLERGHTSSLLLRAQVMLEVGDQISEGQQLLESAFSRGEHDETKEVWWRVQTRVRSGDERFQYFCLEVAAARREHDRVLEIAEGLRLLDTAYAQDGAIHERVADAKALLGREDIDVADSYRAAARAYKDANHPAAALEALSGARRHDYQPQDDLESAVLRWQMSIQPDLGDPFQILEEALRTLDGIPTDADRDTVWSLVYTRGLVLARQAQLEDDPDSRSRRPPLPWLLTTVLAQPNEAYPQAHLAWALLDAALYRPAFVLAERASGLLPEDDWIRETLVVTSVNWCGALSRAGGDALDAIAPNNEGWAATVLGFLAMLAGDKEALRDHIPRMTFDAVWAQAIKAMAITWLDGVAAAKGLLESLVDLALSNPSRALLGVDCALVLGETDVAQRLVEAASDTRAASAATVEDRRNLCKVLEHSDEGAVRELRRSIGSHVRPFALLELSAQLLPSFAAGQDPESNQYRLLEQLRTVAVERHGALPYDPSLLVELEDTHGPWTDPPPEPALVELLRAAEALIAGDDATARSTALGAAAKTDDSKLGQALRVLFHQA